MIFSVHLLVTTHLRTINDLLIINELCPDPEGEHHFVALSTSFFVKVFIKRYGGGQNELVVSGLINQHQKVSGLH